MIQLDDKIYTCSLFIYLFTVKARWNKMLLRKVHVLLFANTFAANNKITINTATNFF